MPRGKPKSHKGKGKGSAKSKAKKKKSAASSAAHSHSHAAHSHSHSHDHGHGCCGHDHSHGPPTLHNDPEFVATFIGQLETFISKSEWKPALELIGKMQPEIGPSNVLLLAFCLRAYVLAHYATDLTHMAAAQRNAESKDAGADVYSAAATSTLEKHRTTQREAMRATQSGLQVIGHIVGCFEATVKIDAQTAGDKLKIFATGHCDRKCLEYLREASLLLCAEDAYRRILEAVIGHDANLRMNLHSHQKDAVFLSDSFDFAQICLLFYSTNHIDKMQNIAMRLKRAAKRTEDRQKYTMWYAVSCLLRVLLKVYRKRGGALFGADSGQQSANGNGMANFAEAVFRPTMQLAPHLETSDKQLLLLASAMFKQLLSEETAAKKRPASESEASVYKLLNEDAFLVYLKILDLSGDYAAMESLLRESTLLWNAANIRSYFELWYVHALKCKALAKLESAGAAVHSDSAKVDSATHGGDAEVGTEEKDSETQAEESTEDLEQLKEAVILIGAWRKRCYELLSLSTAATTSSTTDSTTPTALTSSTTATTTSTASVLLCTQVPGGSSTLSAEALDETMHFGNDYLLWYQWNEANVLFHETTARIMQSKSITTTSGSPLLSVLRDLNEWREEIEEVIKANSRPLRGAHLAKLQLLVLAVESYWEKDTSVVDYVTNDQLIPELAAYLRRFGHKACAFDDSKLALDCVLKVYGTKDFTLILDRIIGPCLELASLREAEEKSEESKKKKRELAKSVQRRATAEQLRLYCGVYEAKSDAELSASLSQLLSVASDLQTGKRKGAAPTNEALVLVCCHLLAFLSLRSQAQDDSEAQSAYLLDAILLLEYFVECNKGSANVTAATWLWLVRLYGHPSVNACADGIHLKQLKASRNVHCVTLSHLILSDAMRANGAAVHFGLLNDELLPALDRFSEELLTASTPMVCSFLRDSAPVDGSRGKSNVAVLFNDTHKYTTAVELALFKEVLTKHCDACVAAPSELRISESLALSAERTMSSAVHYQLLVDSMQSQLVSASDKSSLGLHTLLQNFIYPIYNSTLLHSRKRRLREEHWGACEFLQNEAALRSMNDTQCVPLYFNAQLAADGSLLKRFSVWMKDPTAERFPAVAGTSEMCVRLRSIEARKGVTLRNAADNELVILLVQALNHSMLRRVDFLNDVLRQTRRVLLLECAHQCQCQAPAADCLHAQIADESHLQWAARLLQAVVDCNATDSRLSDAQLSGERPTAEGCVWRLLRFVDANTDGSALLRGSRLLCFALLAMHSSLLTVCAAAFGRGRGEAVDCDAFSKLWMASLSAAEVLCQHLCRSVDAAKSASMSGALSADVWALQSTAATAAMALLPQWKQLLLDATNATELQMAKTKSSAELTKDFAKASMCKFQLESLKPVVNATERFGSCLLAVERSVASLRPAFEARSQSLAALHKRSASKKEEKKKAAVFKRLLAKSRAFADCRLLEANNKLKQALLTRDTHVCRSQRQVLQMHSHVSDALHSERRSAQ